MASEKPVAVLRGAGVAVNTKSVRVIAAALVLTGLIVASLSLFLAGLHGNAQINELKTQGVHVQARVTGCVGLLGGSGSNAAGYQCYATYSLGGHRSRVSVPGSTLYTPGTMVSGVAVPKDPTLFTTSSLLKGEHPSNGVFVLPGVLAAMTLVCGGLLLLVHRRRRATSRQRVHLATRSVLT